MKIAWVSKTWEILAPAPDKIGTDFVFIGATSYVDKQKYIIKMRYKYF